MKNGYFKYYKSKPLVGFIIIIVLLILLTKDFYALSLSLMFATTFLIIIITEYLWCYKPFKWMFWVDDFSGRYEGKLVYQRRDENGIKHTGELDHIKVIRQTGSRIHITSFTKKDDGTFSSSSTNKGIHVEPTEDSQHFRIIYTYLNNGSVQQEFPCHYGTEIIKFIKTKNDKTLTGGYYTDRLPFQTKGEFKDLKRVSKYINHEF